MNECYEENNIKLNYKLNAYITWYHIICRSILKGIFNVGKYKKILET